MVTALAWSAEKKEGIISKRLLTITTLFSKIGLRLRSRKNIMTIRELDNHIEAQLNQGPRQVAAMMPAVQDRCTVYDMRAALRMWERNGTVRQLADGSWVRTRSAPAEWLREVTA